MVCGLTTTADHTPKETDIQLGARFYAMRTMQFKYKRCLDPPPEGYDEYEGWTPDEIHMDFINYWDRKANQAREEQMAGYLDALLPRLVAATGLPAQELVRQSAARWLTARRREEEAEEAAHRVSYLRWYRTYGPGGHHRPDLEYG